jgi:hypothetical protein
MKTTVKANKECERAHGLIMKYMDGELDESGAALLRDHASACADCKADFEIYDFISSELQDTGLTPAPESFVVDVMKIVSGLPQPKQLISNSFDRIMRIALGLFSILFGIGFLLVLNRESIIDYLHGVPAFEGIMETAVPAAESLGAGVNELAGNAYGAFINALEFVSDYRYILAGGIILLVVMQVILYRKRLVRKTAVDKAKSK